MKNTVILIDANVILDYVLVRQPQFGNSVRIISACQNKIVEGFVAFHSLPSIWYVLRKYSVPNCREIFSELTNFLTVVAAPHEEVVNAIRACR